ncbi:MAG: ketoacyl-ACP synthase III [Chloroflexi bacterium]|jgi:3-oxoacyl-[acyl-carrier-protein] synthase-3|nr:ketoacyl-ACP synthase III [Chloroflexota bacterium]
MYVPKQAVSNDELAQRGLDTSDEWIRTRTGIARRHLAGDHETTAQMAIAAAHDALEVADADPREIDLIILATVTSNHLMPSTACMVQDALGAIRAGAFDLNAGCSGFVYALSLAQQAIASGEHNLVLVIGAETLSRVLNWEDRGTCVLFGDGAGAVLLRATEGPAGIQASVIGSDGSGSNLLIIPAGGSAMPATRDTVDQKLHCIQMNGQEVFRFATTILAQATEQVVTKAGWQIEDVALIVPHQANMRIIASASKRLKLPVERFVVNLEEYGNTSAASIPIALCEAVQAGRIAPGENIVLVGFGAGLTWGATAIKWSVAPGEAAAPSYRNVWRWLLYRWAGLRSFTRQKARRMLVLFIRKADHLGRR